MGEIGTSTPETIHATGVQPLFITANGHSCNVDAFGFSHGKPKQSGRISGFKTGDIVRAVVTQGKKIGTYTGQVLVRATGSFDIVTRSGRVQGIGYHCCAVLHQAKGYAYAK
jgi:hypothetical protein